MSAYLTKEGLPRMILKNILRQPPLKYRIPVVWTPNLTMPLSIFLRLLAFMLRGSFLMVIAALGSSWWHCE